MARVCGLDPAAGGGYSGYAVLEGSCSGSWDIRAGGRVRSLYRALEAVRGCTVAGVDAPLTLPYRGFRAVEREFMRLYRARLLPGGLRGMRMLAARGFSIRQFMEEAGIAVIETHPGTVAALSGISGWRGDEVDSILAAGVAAAHYCGVASYVVGEDGVLGVARVRLGGGVVEVSPVPGALLGP